MKLLELMDEFQAQLDKIYAARGKSMKTSFIDKTEMSEAEQKVLDEILLRFVAALQAVDGGLELRSIGLAVYALGLAVKAPLLQVSAEMIGSCAEAILEEHAKASEIPAKPISDKVN